MTAGLKHVCAHEEQDDRFDSSMFGVSVANTRVANLLFLVTTTYPTQRKEKWQRTIGEQIPEQNDEPWQTVSAKLIVCDFFFFFYILIWNLIICPDSELVDKYLHIESKLELRENSFKS